MRCLTTTALMGVPTVEVHARLAVLDPAVMALEQEAPIAIEKLNHRSIDLLGAAFHPRRTSGCRSTRSGTSNLTSPESAV